MTPNAASDAQEMADLALLAALEAGEILAGGHASGSISNLVEALGEAGGGHLERAMDMIGTGCWGFSAPRQLQTRWLKAVCEGSRAAHDLQAVRDLCHAIHDVLMIGPDTIRPDVISGTGRRSRSRSRGLPPRMIRTLRTAPSRYRLPA